MLPIHFEMAWFMETKFTQFLRSGGSGGFVFSQGTSGLVAHLHSRKADIPGFAALMQQFATNLDFADQINADLLLRFRLPMAGVWTRVSGPPSRIRLSP